MAASSAAAASRRRARRPALLADVRRASKPQGRSFETVVSQASSVDLGPREHLLLRPLDAPAGVEPCPSTSCAARRSTTAHRSTRSDPDEHLRFAVLSWAALVACQYMGFRARHRARQRLADGAHPAHAAHGLRVGPPLRPHPHRPHDPQHRPPGDVRRARACRRRASRRSAQHFHQDQLREGRINFLLTGILYANAITTVSPTYAREIQTPEHGVGLDAFLGSGATSSSASSTASTRPSGAPSATRTLPQRYSADELDGQGAVQAGAPRRGGAAVPRTRCRVIGIVSRLAWQKGFDLCMAVLPALLARRAFQLVVLGTGEPRYEEFFTRARGAVSAAGRLPRGVQRAARAPHRGGRGHVPHAVALRAVRPQPDVQPALRNGADRPPHRRAGRHGGAVR